MTPTPTTAAPDPVRVARAAVIAHYQRHGWAGWSASEIQCGAADHIPLMVMTISVARAMQEAMPPNGGEALRLNIQRKVGMYGSAYDGPTDARAYTYQHQPSNQPAWMMGAAVSEVAKDPAGDFIDTGLALLRRLGEKGFGIFSLVQNEVLTSEPLPAPEVKDAPAEAGGAVSPADAFEIGYVWRGMLQGQTLEDSRAVGRTLLNPLFDRLRLDLTGFNSFDTADAGICDGKARIRSSLSLATPQEGLDPAFDANRIARVAKEEGENGAACGWRSCTGCHETEDGYSVGSYPHSKIFGCEVGSGCSECGGLGVVWEHWPASVLEEMAKDLNEPTTPAPAASDELVERLRAETPFYGWKDPADYVPVMAPPSPLMLEAADRIEADAAEMERKDARIAELLGERARAYGIEIAARDARDTILALVDQEKRLLPKAVRILEAVGEKIREAVNASAALRPEAKGGQEP